MLIESVSLERFVDAMREAGREGQFSQQALFHLHDWLNEYDEDIEMDIIAICCEFYEVSAEDVRMRPDDFDVIAYMGETVLARRT